MSAKLIIYFLDDAEVKFRLFPSLKELKLFLYDHSMGGLIHLSLNPPSPSKFLSKLSETGDMLFVSVSLANADCNSDLIFEKTFYTKFNQIAAYPLKEIFGVIQKFDEGVLLEKTIKGEETSFVEVENELLSDYFFSVRTSNVFEAYNIQNISDLLHYSEEDLLRLTNFGQKSLTEIKLFLEKRDLKLGQKKNIKFVVPQSENTLNNAEKSELRAPSQIINDFKRSLETLEDRLKKVIILRSGLEGEPLTLKETGQLMGFTRERARQIEANGVKKLSIPKHSGWQREYYSKVILDLFEHAQFAVTPNYLFEKLNCLANCRQTFSVISFILGHLLEVPLYKSHLGDVEIFTRINQEELDKLIKIGAKVVKQSEGKSVSSIIDEFSLFVTPLAREVTKDIIFHLLKNSEIREIQGESVLLLYSARRSATAVAYKIIVDANTPVNTEQIEAIIKEEFPDYNMRTVVNAFANLRGIFPFRHGVWGAVNHLPFDDDEIEVLKVYLNDFSNELGSQQFHARDFFKFVESKSPSIAIKTDEFQVSGFIRNFSSFHYLGRNMFSDKDTDLRRIFIHDIVVEVLLRHGKPMHGDKIKEEVNKIRSVSNRYQIQSKSPIKALGGNVFSLEFWELDESIYQGLKKRKRITTDEEKTIEDLWLSGEPASYIGRKLGRDPGVIYSVVSRLGIQREKILKDLLN